MLYNQVDEEFLDKRNYDPNKYIDKKLQKIVINPGVPYISTSNDAVFEIRNKKAAAKVGNQTNQFIALPSQELHSLEGEKEEVYLFTIKPVFDAP